MWIYRFVRGYPKKNHLGGDQPKKFAKNFAKCSFSFLKLDLMLDLGKVSVRFMRK